MAKNDRQLKILRTIFALQQNWNYRREQLKFYTGFYSLAPSLRNMVLIAPIRGNT